ncbi:hypothetical protein SteCoe_33486 [Stentor coeruleus]|uniref:Uncharacterized protein n=1 Tax=Stentor coeruleus TaxID=5963 RepID=A0A1R2AWM0_9CILI|nr:hypothetical protein SteCoe_33486 [Stentor coeruleus]
MDLSDSSKLLKTFNLNKALESLSCNEDSNAVDSLYTKSTTCEASNHYSYSNSIFGESLAQSIAPSSKQNIMPEFEIKLNAEKRKASNLKITDRCSFGDFTESYAKTLQIWFFDELCLDVKINPDNTIQDLIKTSLNTYTSKNYPLPDGMFMQLYDVYNEDCHVLDVDDKIGFLTFETLYLRRNQRTNLILSVTYEKMLMPVEIGLEDSLLNVMRKINQAEFFPVIFDRENFLFSSKIAVHGLESECDLSIDLLVKFLPSEKLTLIKKVYLDMPGEAKITNDREFKVGMVDKNSKVTKKLLCIKSDYLTIGKCNTKENKSLINKIKMFVKKKQRLDIPFADIVSIKRIERINSLEIAFKIKRKSKFIIIDAENPENFSLLHSVLNSLITVKNRTI